MKIYLKYLICVLTITHQAYGLQWVSGLFKKKSPEEIAADEKRATAEKAKKGFWDALKEGADEDAMKSINGAIDAFEKAVPGTKIEMIFIIQNNNNTQSNTTQVGPIDESRLKKYRTLLSKGQNNINLGFQSLTEYIMQHKKRVFYVACIGAYVTIQLALISIKQNLRTMQCWSTWEKNIHFEQFPQKLLNEIQHYYCNVSNPADFVAPLICFMEDIEHEKYYLQKYVQLISWLEDFYIHKFFLHDTKLYQTATERIQRLTSMKQSFIAWLSDFKIQQVQSNSSQNLLCVPDALQE